MFTTLLLLVACDTVDGGGPSTSPDGSGTSTGTPGATSATTWESPSWASAALVGGWSGVALGDVDGDGASDVFLGGYGPDSRGVVYVAAP